MIRGETFKMALDALRSNKFKAFLTAFGVVIGSACLVLVVTVGLTGKRYILQQIEGIGSNLIYGYHIQAGTTDARPLADEVSLADLQAIGQLPGVLYAAGTFDHVLTMPIRGKDRAISVVGVTEDFSKVRNLDVVQGRFLDQIDMQTRAKACVITEQLAKLLPFDNPVGQQLKVGELTLTIVAHRAHAFFWQPAAGEPVAPGADHRRPGRGGVDVGEFLDHVAELDGRQRRTA